MWDRCEKLNKLLQPSQTFWFRVSGRFGSRSGLFLHADHGLSLRFRSENRPTSRLNSSRINSLPRLSLSGRYPNQANLVRPEEFGSELTQNREQEWILSTRKTSRKVDSGATVQYHGDSERGRDCCFAAQGV